VEELLAIRSEKRQIWRL